MIDSPPLPIMVPIATEDGREREGREMARKGESGAAGARGERMVGWVGSWANKGGERGLKGRQYASNFGRRVYTEGPSSRHHCPLAHSADSSVSNECRAEIGLCPPAVRIMIRLINHA